MGVFVILAIIFGTLLVLMSLSCMLFGFRSVGVAAGSCAACCQSIIGNVVKGSCFAIMTCLAMRGCFIALLIVGLLVLIGVGIYLMINSEWFQSACNWVKSTSPSFGIKGSSEVFKYAYSWTTKIAFSNYTNNSKGFLHR